MNHKRVQRLWRDEGLRVPQQSPKRRRLGQSTVAADRLRAERPNHVWALDFMFDTTSDGRPFKVLSMCDEFTKECLEGPLEVTHPGRLRSSPAFLPGLRGSAAPPVWLEQTSPG